MERSVPITNAQCKRPVDMSRRILKMLRFPPFPFRFLVRVYCDRAEILARRIHHRQCPMRPLPILIPSHNRPTHISLRASPETGKIKRTA